MSCRVLLSVLLILMGLPSGCRGRTTHEEMILGNPRLLTELRTLVATHADSAVPLRTTVAWNARRMEVTTVTRGRGQQALIGRGAMLEWNGAPREAIFLLRGETLLHGQLYPPGTRVVEVMDAMPGLAESAAFEALFALQSYVINSLGYLAILKGAEFSKGVVANAAADRTAAIFYRRFAPVFLHFANATDPRMRAMVAEARRHLLLGETAQAEISALITTATHAMQRALTQFRWQGAPMTRAQFYNALASTPDAAARQQLTAAYSAAVLDAHRTGLFPALDRLNAVVRTHGFRSYAAYASEHLYDIPIDQFFQRIDDFSAQHDRDIRRFLATLQPEENVAEWDVEYLAQAGLQVPHLTFAEGLVAAKAFYRDVGFDLDAPPFAGQIFFDTAQRPDKYGNAFAARLGDGSQSWFHANFAPQQSITLANLRTIVHELAHSIHGIIGAQGADGNGALGMAAQPLAWREGVARALDALVTTGPWLDRYLAPFPQFADLGLRQRLARLYDGLRHYEQMVIFARARFELQLYDDRLPLEERLDAWSGIAERYLHVRTMPGRRGGVIWATPHFATSPCSYVTYAGGYSLATRAVAPIAEALRNDPKRLPTAGQQLAALFRQGAVFTSLDTLATALLRSSYPESR